jgi:hypothetical protein
LADLHRQFGGKHCTLCYVVVTVQYVQYSDHFRSFLRPSLLAKANVCREEITPPKSAPAAKENPSPTPANGSPPVADWSRVPNGAQLISHNEFAVMFESLIWLWTDSQSNNRVSVLIKLPSGMRFVEGDVQVEVLNPETEYTQAIVSFKTSSAFTNPDYLKKYTSPCSFTRNHSMMVGYNSAVKTDLDTADAEPKSKMRIDIGVPCEESLATIDVLQSIHVLTEMAPECVHATTVEEGVKAGMKCKKCLVFHLMGPRSKFSQKKAVVEDDEDGGGWFFAEDMMPGCAPTAKPHSPGYYYAKRSRSD